MERNQNRRGSDVVNVTVAKEEEKGQRKKGSEILRPFCTRHESRKVRIWGDVCVWGGGLG